MKFAMQPNLNMDREGSGSPEQIRKYDQLAEQMDSRVTAMSDTYDELIRAFHTQLFI